MIQQLIGQTLRKKASRMVGKNPKGRTGRGGSKPKWAKDIAGKPAELDRTAIPQFGSEDGGGFNTLTKSYKENPSIENYLKIRREHPGAEIEIAVIGGMEQLFFMEPELRRFGINPNLVASVMDANEKAISEMALQLLEKLVERNRKLKAGETHVSRRGTAIPDKLVDWMIACALDALSWNDNLYIPRDLIVLIRERLGGSKPEYEKASHAHEMRWNALITGGQLLAQGHKPTFRLLSKFLDVAPSTVKRWFPDGEFLQEVERIAGWFDENGKLKPMYEMIEGPLRKK